VFFNKLEKIVFQVLILNQLLYTSFNYSYKKLNDPAVSAMTEVKQPSQSPVIAWVTKKFIIQLLDVAAHVCGV
jgi:hypothetical protein